jgi:STE24 endopeptidase
VSEKFEKAQLYGLDKSSFAFFSSSYDQVITTLQLVLGLMPFMWAATGPIVNYFGYTDDYELVRSGVLMALVNIVETGLSLPIQLYKNFVIEERHGFNKQTLFLFFKDLIISYLLTVCLMIPLLLVVIQIIKYGGEYFHYYAWSATMLLMVVMMFVYPEVIAPLFNKYTPLEDGSLKSKIETLGTCCPLSHPLTLSRSYFSLHFYWLCYVLP